MFHLIMKTVSSWARKTEEDQPDFLLIQPIIK